MTNEPANLRSDSQATRRVKYGLNLIIGILAAIAIAVMANWIAYRNYMRFDLTATRQYSLSQQTTQFLRNLEKDYHIVTLFSDFRSVHERVRDLVDEYGRYSNRLDIEHIDLNVGTVRHEQFFNEVLNRFEQDLQPAKEVVDRGRKALQRTRSGISGLSVPLKSIAEDPSMPSSELKQLIKRIPAVFAQADAQMEEIDRKVGVDLSQILPDLDSARSSIENILRQLNDNIFAIASAEFQKAADASDIPTAIKNHLLKIAQSLNALAGQNKPILDQLQDLESTNKYENVRSDLLSTESIAVLGPKQIRVIPIAQMFREPDPEQVRRTGQPELRFLGEERLTGTLLSMGMDQPPLIVFVITGAQPAIGPGGTFEIVAQRLRNANFEVQQWNPSGQFSQFGQPLPPSPPPVPKAGQKAIWVVTPFPSPDPRNPMAMNNDGKQQVADLVKRRMENDDAAMFMLTIDPLFSFGTPNPVVELLKNDWGISPQLDRIVMQEVRGANRQSSGTPQIMVDQWPAKSPITAAMGRMPAIFIGANPLDLDHSNQNVQHHPLVQLSGRRLWAESDLQALQSPDQVQFDKADSQPSFLIGALAEKQNQRLLVINDGMWATNRITNYGIFGPETAELMGAAFPGNSELFVNSIYWLAGLDQLIASSARSQDIRRIKNNLKHTELIAYRWLLLGGLPIAIVITGLGVWFTRRQ